MSNTAEHQNLILAAARAALLPIGCVRKGRSRTWYSDQGFWAIEIEFQPSGWSKGSYLNIGPRWLWRERSGRAFSYRPTDFILFESTDQFTPLIETMAGIAARETLAMRKRFSSLSDITHYLISNLRDGWPVLDAAIASYLVGDVETSRTLFLRMEQWPTYGYEWQQNLKQHARGLALMLDDPARFRSSIIATIQLARKSINLKADLLCLGTVNGIDAR